MQSNSDTRPIGVFDSGLGGISVLKHAVDMLQAENFIYYGDDKNAPYGSKPIEVIQELTLACGDFLWKKDVKAILMACNTATGAAVKLMRDKYKIPVISIEPAVKPAVEECSRDKKVLVMATPATIRQERYRNLLSKVAAGDRVYSMPCDGLAKIIEQGDINSIEIEKYLSSKLIEIAHVDIESVVIGCTHYSFIIPQIKSALAALGKEQIKIFDGMFGTVRQLKRVLGENGLLNTESNRGEIAFYSSGNERQLGILKDVFFEYKVQNL